LNCHLKSGRGRFIRRVGGRRLIIRTVESLKGSLLVAGGQLFDPNFRKAVVLLAEGGEEGAMGLVLNRPASVSVQEAAPSLASLVPPGAPLFLGGPVQPEQAIVLAEFDDPALAGTLVLDSIGLPMSGLAPEDLKGIRRARVFAGFAGWGPGQLEGELAMSSWIVEPALPADVFTEDPGELWSAVLRRKGGSYQLLSLMPWDPSSN
jgi:putative transcriptional regulator